MKKRMVSRAFLRISSALLLSLLVVLASIQLECYRERDQLDQRMQARLFQPGLTKVANLPLCFCTQGRDQENFEGIDSIVKPPKCADDVHNVTIQDARKSMTNGCHELEEDVNITDWRTNDVMDKVADIIKFYQPSTSLDAGAPSQRSRSCWRCLCIDSNTFDVIFLVG